MSPSRTKVPLIPESLVDFYRRTRKAFRLPPSRDSIAISNLSRVVELHHRAAAAAQAAIEQSDTDGQERLADLCREETRLADAVGEFVIELGGSPPRPEESSLELPREPPEMSRARDQAELMSFVREDLDFVARAHQELKLCPEIPSSMREPLEALLGTTLGGHLPRA
jgi:hypothetical protein